MTPERWHKIGEIFAAVMEADTPERTDLLSKLCGTDAILRAEVESMISAQRSIGDFLEAPSIDEMPTDAGVANLPTDSGEKVPIQDLLTPEAVQLGRGLTIAERYVVERELGRGGIGVVYLARDQQLHARLVVIKVLMDTGSASKWTLKKFLHESEALSRIDHPNIVKVFDRGTLADGRRFIVMEYVPGTTLREEIKAGPLPLNRVARIAEQMGRALHAAHGAGVFHRDLKPENVMIREMGEGEIDVKVIDFGIAKVTDPVSTKVTLENVYAGTLHYMAPEQMEDAPCTSAVDVYAMGIIAYEMLTGERPFQLSTSNLALAFRQLTDQQKSGVRKSPRELRTDIPSGVEAVILRALRYNPGERYQSAKQFAEHLAKSLRGADSDDLQIDTVPSIAPWEPPPTIIAHPEPRRISRHSVMAAAIAAPLIFLGIWWFLPRSSNQLAEPVKPPVTATPVSQAVDLLELRLEKFRTTPGAPSSFVLPDTQFSPGEGFKLRFLPKRSGFLYVLASTDRNRHALLLTGTPTLENRATTDREFVFPKASDAFLGVKGNAPVTTFRIVFSPAPLAVPGFLAGKPGVELTADEEIEFQRFWQNLPTLDTAADTSNQNPFLRYRTAGKDDRPVRFEVVIRNPVGK